MFLYKFSESNITYRKKKKEITSIGLLLGLNCALVYHGFVFLLQLYFFETYLKKKTIRSGHFLHKAFL